MNSIEKRIARLERLEVQARPERRPPDELAGLRGRLEDALQMFSAEARVQGSRVEGFMGRLERLEKAQQMLESAILRLSDQIQAQRATLQPHLERMNRGIGRANAVRRWSALQLRRLKREMMHDA